MCTELLETVQFPLALKFTTSPELAVALTTKSASPKGLSARALNVIVWLALLTVSVSAASAEWVELVVLACCAVMVVVPAPVVFAVVLVMVEVLLVLGVATD